MAFFRLWDALRFFHGGENKVKPAFRSEREAYDFLRNLYKRTGGVTPELRRSYEFYLKNSDEGFDEFAGFDEGPRSQGDGSRQPAEKV